MQTNKTTQEQKAETKDDLLHEERKVTGGLLKHIHQNLLGAQLERATRREERLEKIAKHEDRLQEKLRLVLDNKTEPSTTQLSLPVLSPLTNWIKFSWEKHKRNAESRSLTHQRKKEEKILAKQTAKLEAIQRKSQKEEEKIRRIETKRARKAAMKEANLEMRRQNQQTKLDRKAAMLKHIEDTKRARAEEKAKHKELKLAKSRSDKPPANTPVPTCDLHPNISVEEEAKREAMKHVLVEQEISKLKGGHKDEPVTTKVEPTKLMQEIEQAREQLTKERQKFESEKEQVKQDAYNQAKTELGSKAAAIAPIQTATPEQTVDYSKIALEKQALEEEKKKFEANKIAWEATKSATPVQTAQSQPTTSAPAQIDMEHVRAEALAQTKVQFEAQRKLINEELAKLKLENEQLKTQAPASGTDKSRLVIEDERKKIASEHAGIEQERAFIKEAARKEAYAQFEEERTKFEIEKEHIKQKALAEAEANILSTMKGRSLFGFKQKEALSKEIEKWKSEAEKVEKQRMDIERMRALQSEQSRLSSTELDIEEEKLKLEREKIAQERESLKHKQQHEEKIKLQKEQLYEEKSELEEEKTALVKKGKGKGEGKGKGKKEVTEKIEEVDIGKILVAQNYLEEKELETAKEKAGIRNVSVENILKEEGLVTPQLIQNAVAEFYDVPFIDLASQPPDTSVVELLPEDIAISLHAIAISKTADGSITIATSNPAASETIIKSIKKINPEAPKITIVYASKSAIEAAFSFYRKPLDTRFRKIIEQHRKIAPEIIEEIFADAIQLGASDVHFEPQEKTVVVRFRVDGVMHEAGQIPREYYEGIVNRIKIAGNMRIDEHFSAQDGAIRWKGGGRAMDVRVSIVPIVDGEKIVMRLLSEYVRTLTLSDLGFTDKQLNVLVKAAHKPFGMILTTGPTGSGKSTTLYGLLKIRNSPDVNISTIEDPVEYKIAGINHIQVNTKADLTFERGLRALVRQDPDIILVGEIRDDITAQISVNAALTGHLLFSTLHANDAATAVPRLLEMSIEPFLLASTLELIIAQRLMRRTCSHCRYSYNIPRSEAEVLFPYAEYYFKDEAEITLYKGKGCGACGNTGYKGRIGIYELLVITPEIEELITERRTSGEINALARKQGMLTLFEDGLMKAQTGLSTIEELLRIAAPPEPLRDGVEAIEVVEGTKDTEEAEEVVEEDLTT